MTRTNSCPDCHFELEIGFVPDYYARIIQSRWHPGTVTARTWAGSLKLDDEALIPITTFRCPQCGLLKQFATK